MSRQVFFDVLGRVFHQVGVDVAGLGVNIDENGDGVLEEQGVAGCDKGERGGDDQVAGADSGGADAQVQTSRARVDSEGVLGPGQVAESLLKTRDVLSHTEDGGVDDIDDRLALGVSQVGGGHGDFHGVILRFQTSCICLVLLSLCFV